MEKEIVILGAKRTPMGGFQGALASLSAVQLGAKAIRAALDQSAVDDTEVNEVYMGCVLSAGLGQAPARQASLNAGLSESVPSTTVNKVCGSGMKSVMLGANQILLDQAELVVAGGMESMSNAPYLLDKARSGYRLGHQKVVDHMFLDGLEDAYDGSSMGLHAQNTANDYQLSREQMDAFALDSLARANKAIDKGWFKEEISPVTLHLRQGDVSVDTDEQPGSAKPEKIPHLRPAFAKDGTITAANSSSISDGASALVLASRDKANSLGARPLAKIIGYCSHAQTPSRFTCAPIGAVRKLLAQCNMSVGDIDLVEINEAFAMVTLLGMQELGFSHEQTNISGGACALGHPLGSSGSRVIVTLLHNLRRTGKKRGLATLCIGGGEATAIIIETL